ncbi:uncharacterized protein OCT59_008497 [Rhizophagus irregularis]|uniref:uncharacterized protein n=1 Tax=Rhizophagus irregularis TaxID=588596 RepID=UPI0033271FDA|nr:hypothetical protein OCT59_008497 [Rhizophagus irregularis]
MEESLAQESLKRVWKVKNFKEIHRAEKVVKEKMDRQSGTQDLYHKMKGISNPKKPNNDKVGSSSKGVALMENQVVDEIDKYNRKGVEDDATIYTVTSKKLQKDNVTTDEDKMTDVLAPKYEELKEIFAKCGEEMEWEAIEKEAVSKTERMEEWMPKD